MAVVSGCGLVGDPADSPTPSPPPSPPPSPTPPPLRLPGETAPEWPCPGETRLPDTVAVSWPAAAPVHQAAGPDGTSVLATGCRPVQWAGLPDRPPRGGS
ncbi:hypothetical protein HEK616_79240 (plasmid) [Streptomyces nigrescens]|uniref:Lipoprotein n=1 Tax=Streptomyces nigrescens TaxID=1920 RepID=A0ABM8A724_STRNI|nr:hypothetical protein HEK616_79240 [Streptomyces nigrescens]